MAAIYDINTGDILCDVRRNYETAIARARDAEARNLSQSTQNKRWREVFAAEDALKAVDGWR